MSKQVALAANVRVGSGKGEARSLRRAGRVPAVAYGTELPSTPVSVDGRELFHVLNTDAGMNAIIRLDIDGRDYLTIARELHRHPLRRDVLHVDFVAIDRNRKIQVDVPIHLAGEAPGSSEGGVVEQSMYTISVEVLPLSVPDEVVLDISEMQIGDVRRVADLELPEGVTALDDPERTVVSVNVPALEVPERAAPLEEAEAEFAEAEGEGAAPAEEGEAEASGE
jgi:large subunit ribosomal protein L25